MRSKDKGDLAELMVAADLVRQEYGVLEPFGDDWRFDLAAYKDGKFIRIQVKYAGERDDVVLIYNSVSNRGYKHQYTSSQIDCLAAYHPASNRCYYLPMSIMDGKSRIQLRLDSRRISSRVNLAEDYLQLNQ